VGASGIHKYGLYTGKNYKANDFVIEYVGEKIRNPVADLREEKYIREGFGDCF